MPIVRRPRWSAADRGAGGSHGGRAALRVVPYLGSTSVVGIGWKFTDGVAALLVAILAAGWALVRYRRPAVTTR